MPRLSIAIVLFFSALLGCISDYHMGVQRVGNALTLSTVSTDVDSALQPIEEMILRALIAGDLTRIQPHLAPALRARLGRHAWDTLQQALVSYRLTGAWTPVRLARSDVLTLRQIFMDHRFEDYEYIEARYELAGRPGALVVLALADVAGEIKIVRLLMEAAGVNAAIEEVPPIRWAIPDKAGT